MEDLYKYNVFNYSTNSPISFKIENRYTGNFKDALVTFLNFYEPDTVVTSPSRKKALNKKNERICRFCNRKYPETSFRKIAHVMPKFIGNNHLVHDCECDACNEKFGLYDDNFAKSIGLLRTVDKIRGYSGIPKFKSADGKLIVSVEKNELGHDWISIVHTSDEELDREAKTIKFNSIKQSYTPLHVMKSLYKIAYSLLHTDEIQDYSTLLTIINTNIFDQKLSDFAKAVKFTFPRPVIKPFAITFKKKIEFKKTNLPTKIVNIQFGRYAYQFFILNTKDKFMYTAGEKCEWLFIPPPYLADSQEEIKLQMLDLSSNVIRKGEPESFIFTFDYKK